MKVKHKYIFRLITDDKLCQCFPLLEYDRLNVFEYCESVSLCTVFTLSYISHILL